jgi:hypothetical protein
VLDASKENRFCAMKRVGDVHTSVYELAVKEFNAVKELDGADPDIVYQASLGRW